MKFHTNFNTLSSSSLSSSSSICFRCLMVMIGILLVHPSLFVDAQAPANDLCINAQPISIGSSSAPVKFNTTSATTDLDVADDCFNGDPPDAPGIWFNFTGTGGRIVARACNPSTYYVYYSIFTGGCNSLTRQCVASTYQYYSCQQERFIFDTILGTSYYVLVQTSSFVDTIDVSIFEAPASNDLCINAQPITIGSSSVPVKFNTTYATTDVDVADDCLNGGPPSYPGIWFNFTGTGGRVAVRACEISLYSTYISVFTGECKPSALQCVAATNNGCQRERFFFESTIGINYFVLVQTFYYDTVDVSFISAPLKNDVCSGAEPFPLGMLLNTDPSLATTDEATVFTDCIDDNAPLYPGLWYNFTGTGDMFVARSCKISFTYITIFSGNCGRTTLQCVKATNNPCASELFTFPTTKDTTYFAFVQSYFDSIVDLTISSVAKNDLCTSAQPLTLGVSVMGNLTFALPDEAEVSDNCADISPLNIPGVWYTFVGTGGRVAVDPCGGLPLTSRIFASVYDGGCGPSNLMCVAAGRIDCGRNELIFQTDLGSTYHILIHAESRYTFEISVFPVGGVPPSVPISPVKAPTAPSPAPTKQPSTIPTRRPSSRPVSLPLPPQPTPLPPQPTPLPPQPTPLPPRRREITISIVRCDPHITSLDGLEFDCQARGEFTLLKSLSSNFHIQARFTKASNTGIGSTASVTSALVVRETGAPIMQISYGAGAGTTVAECLALVQLYEGGITRPLNSGTNPSGVSVTVVNPDEVVLLFSTGLEVHVIVKTSPSFGCFFSQWIALPDNYRSDETLTGLLGNANGNPYDDWQTKLGITLPTPNNETALYQGSYDYCRTEWCLRSVTDSLFTYRNGTSFTSYFECDAPYQSDLETAVAAASPALRTLCGTDVRCIVDGTAGGMMDAQNFVSDTIRIAQVLEDRNITYNFNETAPAVAPTTPPCGLFRRSIFCPLKFRGILGRFIRGIFG